MVFGFGKKKDPLKTGMEYQQLEPEDMVEINRLNDVFLRAHRDGDLATEKIYDEHRWKAAFEAIRNGRYLWYDGRLQRFYDVYAEEDR